MLYEYLKTIKKNELDMNDMKLMSLNKFTISIDNNLSDNDVSDCIKNEAIVILLLEDNKMNGHYISICCSHQNRRIFFFDSYGNHPNTLSEKYGDNIINFLSSLKERTNYKIEINTQQLQEYDSEINNCGRYAILRCFLKDYSNITFCDLLDDKIYIRDSDMLITIMTCIFDLSQYINSFD